MAMIIPAIDVLDGRCVRLKRGNRSEQTVYDPDPVAVAMRFAAAGAQRLHVVDLGGAFGQPQPALPVLKAIAAKTRLPVQYGGGLRTIEQMRSALSAGARWVIAGTAPLADPGFLAAAATALGGLDRMILALDLRNGRPLIEGWQAQAAADLPVVLNAARAAGVRTVMVTDTGADGTMGGIRMDVYRPVVEAGFRVIAAGGVASLDDVRGLAGEWGGRGLEGIVVGSALLKGAFTISDAQSVATAATAAANCAGGTDEEGLCDV